MMTRRWMMAAVMLTLGGCDGGGAGNVTTSSVEGAPSALVLGLEAPGNDAKVVQLLKETLACPRSGQALDPKCPAFAAWQESELLVDGKADATLVSLLEDASEQVRQLAADRLRVRGKIYRTDAKLARRVLDAAAKETAESVAVSLGSAAATIDGKTTHLDEPLGQLIGGAKLPALRRALLSGVLVRNPSHYDRVSALASDDADVGIRRVAVNALWGGTPPDRFGDSCALWLERAQKDPDPQTAAEAAYLCAAYPQGDGCRDQWDPLMDDIEKKSEAGQVTSARLPSALGSIHNSAATSKAQKKRARLLTRSVVKRTTNGEYARAQALAWLGENDPGAKAFATAFADDAHPKVKAAAKRVLGGAK